MNPVQELVEIEISDISERDDDEAAESGDKGLVPIQGNSSHAGPVCSG